MTKQHDTKTTLIKIGMELISAQGYNATGISAVLKQAGVPKGSFYHHFESKEDFGLAVIESFIVDVLKVHPLMVVRGLVVHNPFYIAPEEFLSH